jgi:hypothetical protein
VDGLGWGEVGWSGVGGVDGEAGLTGSRPHARPARASHHAQEHGDGGLGVPTARSPEQGR